MLKKIFILVLIGYTFQACKEPILVMSYNIRYNNPNDGDNHWDFRKKTISNFVLEQQPDVFGLQEVTHTQLLDLLEEWSVYDFIGVGREDGMTKGEYSPLFYKSSKYKVLTFGTFWLSETPDTISVGWDAALERICSYAHLEAYEGGERFWVFNTHFDHRGEKAREKAANLLIETIAKLNTFQDPVLLMGDFNLTPETPPIRQITAQFNDVYKASQDPPSQAATYNGFDESQFGDKRIDYIFTQNCKIKEATHVALKTPMGGWASDHHPVQAKLTFTK